MNELTEVQKRILKQSDYELKEFLVDAYVAAERRYSIAKASSQTWGHDSNIEWYNRRMDWLKKFIKLMEEGHE